GWSARAARLRPAKCGPLGFRTQLWSKPCAVVSCTQDSEVAPAVQSEIDGKIGFRRLKSNGVPPTGASWPVGIRPESVGVKVLALIWPNFFNRLPQASPAMLK